MSHRSQSALMDDFPLLAQARALWALGRWEAALERFGNAVTEQPRNVRALVEYARALGQRYEIGRAEALLAEAARLAGADLRVAPLIAQSYRLLYRPLQAIAELEQLRQTRSLPAPLLGELAVLYEQTGRLEEALAAIHECLERAAGQVEPKLILGRFLRARGEWRMAQSLLEELTCWPDATPLFRVRAWSELCHVRDALQDYDGAMAAVEEAKQILRRSPEAERLSRRSEAINEAFRRLYAQLDRHTLEDWRRVPLPADPRCRGIAHLLGFPRSGTTLLEQMLDAHPGIAGSPERPVFSREIFPAMYRIRGDEPLTFASLFAIPVQRLIDQRRRYLDFMEAILGQPLGGRAHLDKNPNHTSLIVGLVRLFPESQFLFMLRDPRDVIVSTYLQFFPLTEYSAAFLTWGSLCKLYASEMNVWLHVREMMSGNWLEVRYEDLVHDPRTTAGRALEFLGLEWNDVVADYRQHTVGKVVNSPSQAAVRQPIHTRAVGRWRNYEKHLWPYLHQLEPFCRVFGYD